MNMNDLPDLKDILDTLIFEDEPSIFSDDYAMELIETALHLMEEYINENPTAITEPDFNEVLLEEIQEMFYIQFEQFIIESDYVEDDLNDILDYAFEIFINTFHNKISLQENFLSIPVSENKNIDNIESKIQRLRNIPQPEQRTPEWYQFRWNLITASNAYKAFESNSMKNQLIYEKCQPIKSIPTTDTSANTTDTPKQTYQVNINTPFHWGQKYEPLSVMLYEYL
jgi:hypothetical protein